MGGSKAPGGGVDSRGPAVQSPSDARRLIAAEQAILAVVLVRVLAEPAEAWSRALTR